MLLFQSDFQTQGGCLQVDTTNKSFIRMVFLLERMGIKNNKFFLHLSQPELAKYDPHNLTDPSAELVARIAHECKVNLWYYLREVIRISVPGASPIPYQLNRANLALSWCFANSVNTFIVMPRQKGKSVGTISLDSWAMYFGYKNAVIAMFAKDDKLIQENVKRMKNMRNNLPLFLVSRSVHDTDNKEGLSYAALRNEYKTYVAQADRLAAMKQARGDTIPLQHWDEFAYYKNNDLSYPAAAASMDTASKIAQEAGLPTGKIITTTAGMLASPAGAYAYRIKSHAARFKETLYDLENRQALQEFLDKESTNNMFYLEYSYQQLGESDEWLKRVTADKTQVEIETDYLNIWQVGTGSGVVPAPLLNRVNNSVIEPIDYSTFGTLTVNWYVAKSVILSEEYKNKYYIIGCDTSDNVGEDFTTLCILDPTDLGVVATCRVNTPSFTHVAQCVTELMEQLPNAIIIPERNKNGAVLVDILIDKLASMHVSPFRRIYNTFIQDWSTTSKNFDMIDLSSGVNRKHFGYNTTPASRDDLYGKVLINELNIMADRVYDYNLAEEIKALSVRNGRIDHIIGQHDDLTMSLMLAGWFALYGKNHHMYGIPSDMVLQGVTNTGSTVDPEVKARHKRLEKRIKELKNILAFESNPIRKASYERELKSLQDIFDPSVIAEDHVAVSAIQSDTASAGIIDTDYLTKLRLALR